MIRLQNLTRQEMYKIEGLETKLSISQMYGFVMTILCCVFATLFVIRNNDSVDQVNQLTIDYQCQMVELSAEYDHYKEANEYVKAQLSSFADTTASLYEISTTLDEQNKQLAKENKEMLEVITKFEAREELFNKYEYAIYDKWNNRTDLTYEQISYLEDLVEETPVNDVDLCLALIMTESNGTEKIQNVSSSAKGYGQFLNTTSKFVYTKLLNNDHWDPSVALDGDTNILMLVTYLNYLYEANDQNLYAALRGYRGINDITPYVRKMDTYLSGVDKSVQLISTNLSMTNLQYSIPPSN